MLLLFREFVEMMREARKLLYPYSNSKNEINEYKIKDKKIKL